MEKLQARLEQQLVKQHSSDSTSMAAASSVNAAVMAAQMAAQHWKEVDLESKRKGWEEVTLEIANAQDACGVSRKNLAESTKAFKKLEDGEKMAHWGSLLKSYQAEIDTLTKRAKATEMNFLGCYKALKDVPEPAAILTDLVDETQRLLQLKTNHEKVVQELEEYKTEFQTLRNQDVTIRRLEEKIAALEDEKRESVEKAVEEEQRQMESQLKMTIEEGKKREKEVQAQLAGLRKEMKEMQSKHDAAIQSHLEEHARLEEVMGAKQAQIDILSEEVDRAVANGAALEREKEQINQQYLELWKKQYANNEGGGGNSGASHASAASKVVELETALQSKDGRVKQLALQVEILEESLQKERDKAQEVVGGYLKEIRQKEVEVVELKSKISELPSLEDHRSLRRQLRVLQAVEYNMVDALDAELGEGGEAREDKDALARALGEQRDRLKASNSVLEAENAALKKKVLALETEARTLRTDNVKMYEKIKFLESYRPSAGSQGPSVDVEASIDSMPNADKYKAMYEESLNPFTVFNQKQKALRRERMDLPERIMLEMSQFFLGNKVARKFLFFYMLFLHFLLYSTVYRFTHRDRSGCKTVASPGAIQAKNSAQAAQALVKDEHGRMRALLEAGLVQTRPRGVVEEEGARSLRARRAALETELSGIASEKT